MTPRSAAVVLKIVESTPGRGGGTEVDINAMPGSRSSPTFVGQYMLGPELAAGGMGSVRVGLKLGALGFQRLVAVKRLHPHLTEDANFVARFKDEIRLVSRLTHPNIVQAFDVIEGEGELALVMEYVDGVTLHELLRDVTLTGSLLPVPIAVGIVSQALHGLHAAHEATDDRGNSFSLVHRDVSPQNIMIGRDGLVKVLDFGVAKASSASHFSRVGQLSGKVSYMSPEQAGGRPVDRRTDVFAAGVVLWETLCGRRLFGGPGTQEATSLGNVLGMQIPVPSELRREISGALDRIVLRALDRDPSRRFGSARDFALALEDAFPTASASAVASAVGAISSARTREQQAALAAFRLQVAQAPDSTLALPMEHRGPASRSQDETVPDAATSLLFEAPTRPFPVAAADPELQTADVQGALAMQGASAPTPGRSDWRRAIVALFVLIPLGAGAYLVSKRGTPAVAIATATSVANQPASKSSSLEPKSNTSPAIALPRPLAIHDLASLPAPDAPTSLKPHRVLRPQRTAPAAMNEAPARPKTSLVAKAPALPKAAALEKAPAVERGPTLAVSAASHCSPPTYTDAEGIRHFKADCL